jgi:hypothetical protein
MKVVLKKTLYYAGKNMFGNEVWVADKKDAMVYESKKVLDPDYMKREKITITPKGK